MPTQSMANGQCSNPYPTTRTTRTSIVTGTGFLIKIHVRHSAFTKDSAFRLVSDRRRGPGSGNRGAETTRGGRGLRTLHDRTGLAPLPPERQSGAPAAARRGDTGEAARGPQPPRRPWPPGARAPGLRAPRRLGPLSLARSRAPQQPSARPRANRTRPKRPARRTTRH